MVMSVVMFMVVPIVMPMPMPMPVSMVMSVPVPVPMSVPVVVVPGAPENPGTHEVDHQTDEGYPQRLLVMDGSGE